MKKIHSAAVILFALILLVPMVFLNIKPNQTSTIDNRNLTEWPQTYAGFQSTVSTLTNYWSDRIGFRDPSITFYTKADAALFGVLDHPLYLFGKDGYVFNNFHSIPANYETYVDQLAGFIGRLQTYCEERNVPFTFCLDPEKQAVYTQYLPTGEVYKDEDMTRLKADLTQENVHFIDTTAVLQEASKTTQVFDQQYDSGHWNDNGAFIGISYILQQLGQDPLSLSAYNITQTLHTSLRTSYFPIHDVTDTYTLKQNNLQTAPDTYAGELKIDPDYSYYTNNINTDDPNGKRILIFGGSYFEDREKFYAEGFSQTIMVQSYSNIADFDYYFNIFHPDEVLFEMAQYVDNDTYFSESCVSTTYNPGYDTLKSLPVSAVADIAGDDTAAQVQNTLAAGDTKLCDISFSLEGDPVAFAYALIDGQVYDFKMGGQTGAQTISITLPKSVLQNAKSFQVALINIGQHAQSIIPVW